MLSQTFVYNIEHSIKVTTNYLQFPVAEISNYPLCKFPIYYLLDDLNLWFKILIRDLKVVTIIILFIYLLFVEIIRK